MIQSENIRKFICQYNSDCIELKRKFSEFENREWTIENYSMELLIQLGHLFYVLKENNSNKNLIAEDFRNLSRCADEICDVIYQVINILNELELKIDESIYCGLECNDDDEIKQVCFILSSQISDAILRVKSYKHSHNRLIDEDMNMILKNCVYILCLMFQFAQIHKIDIFVEFGEMIKDARNYIENFEEKKYGFHCEIEKREIILKKIDISKVYDLGFRINTDNILKELTDYICELKLEKIKIIIPLKMILEKNKIFIYQEYIKGYQLSDFIKKFARNIDYYDVLRKIFVDIVNENILLNKTNPNIRIDNNICNFIVELNLNNKDYTLSLVDIYPPLFVNKISKLNFIDNNYFYNLSLNLKLSIVSFTYYYIKTFIDGLNDNESCQDAKKFVLDIIEYVKQVLECFEYPDEEEIIVILKSFKQKFKVMMAYLDGDESDKKYLTREIKSWSITQEYIKHI